MSEYLTIYVMKSDIASGAIAPPKPKRRPPPVPVPTTPVQGYSQSELQQHLTELLSSALPKQVLSEVMPDGSPRVASLIAVWLLSQIGAAVGRPKLVNLSKVRREELRSLGGVARLAFDALHSSSQAVAS
jgi:hypothetical protein